MKRKYKFIALALALCLLVVPVLRPQRAVAVAPTGISVIGGAIGTGGLAGGAAAGATILPVLGVVGLTLAAAGLTVYIGDQAAAEGMTRTEYIAQKISDFATATGSTADRVYNDLSGQLETTQDGNVIIGRVAADWIGRFGDWLFSSGAVTVPVAGNQVSVVRPVSGLPDPFTFYSDAVSISSYSYYGSDGVRMAIICSADSNNPGRYYYYVVFGSLSAGTSYEVYQGQVRSSSLSASSYSGNPFYFRYRSVNPTGSLTPEQAGVTGLDVYDLGYRAFDHAGAVAYNLVYGDVSVPDVLDGFQGDENTWTQNRDLLKPGEDEATVLTPPDVLNPAGAAAGAGEYTVSVPDYLTALADAYNAVGAADAAISVPLTNTATGVKQAVDVQAAAVDTSPSVAVDSDGFSGTTGLVDPEAEPSAGDVIDAMRVDVKLEDVFPFSIPYNFFHLLEKFVATPVAPQWDFDYTFPIGEGFPVHWHMDLTPYESWAVVIRWGVRVGWMATLAGAAQRRIKY